MQALKQKEELGRPMEHNEEPKISLGYIQEFNTSSTWHYTSVEKTKVFDLKVKDN